MNSLAQIERGTITEETEHGYRAASTDRPGIVTPPMTGIQGEKYAKGDRVYFFLFPDGTGKILCRL